MRTIKHPVIVLGGGEANGLGIARNLGRQGIPVYCVTSNPHELMRFSRYCCGSQVVPRIEGDARVLAAWLTAMRPKWQARALLFATTDTALLTLASLCHELNGYIPVIPRRDLVEMMVVKSQFYQSLAKHAVPHPRTTLASEARCADDSELQFPVFLRPVESLPFFEQFGVKGFLARDRRALARYIQRTASYHLPLLVQEIIPGPARQGYILRGYVDQRARPLALLVTQKLRQPSMFATNTGVLSIPLTEFKEGVSLLLRYFRTIGYHGLFGAEFKRDPRDGVLKLLEINARSQGGNNVGAVCGVNHILAAYRDRLDQPPLPITAYRSGIYYGAVCLDVWSVLQMALQGELHGHDIRDYLRPTSWNYLDRADPAPFVRHLWHLGSGIWSRIFPAH